MAMAAPCDAEQRESVETRGIGDEFEVGDLGRERDVGVVTPVGKPVPRIS